jgi:hypothetical protein
MGVIIKKIGGSEYAYLVVREGKRVVHTYLGPAGSPRVIQRLHEKNEVKAVPPRLRALFWDTSIEKIHMKRNARYIIERVLELGDMDAIEWLQRVYPTRRIIEVLHLSRVLTEKSRNFWLLWFGVGTA